MKELTKGEIWAPPQSIAGLNCVWSWDELLKQQHWVSWLFCRVLGGGVELFSCQTQFQFRSNWFELTLQWELWQFSLPLILNNKSCFYVILNFVFYIILSWQLSLSRCRQNACNKYNGKQGIVQILSHRWLCTKRERRDNTSTLDLKIICTLWFVIIFGHWMFQNPSFLPITGGQKHFFKGRIMVAWNLYQTFRAKSGLGRTYSRGGTTRYVLFLGQFDFFSF